MKAILTDLALLSTLLLVGITLRKKVKLFQNLYIPASLLAGFVGLILGPQILGKVSPVCFPVTETMGSWAGQLVNIVLGLSFLGKTSSSKSFGKTALCAVTEGGLVHQTQVCLGLGITMLLMPLYDNLPFCFGLTPVFGFHGGHGTANAAGEALAQAGWADGPAVANTMATAGILSGIIFGMIIINIGVRRGYAKMVDKPSNVPQELKEGIVPKEKRVSLGNAVTYNDALDPLALQLCFVGIIYGAATLLSQGLVKLHPILSNVPLFACAMICGAILNFIMNKLGLQDYLDRPTLDRISGVALDFLVASAITTLSLKVFALYTVPLIVTILAVMLGNIVCNFYFGYKMFDDDWFERTVTAYGLESGVLATGLMLLRVVDPKFETTGHESGAASAALCYPWSLPYVLFAPALAFIVAPIVMFGFSAALWIVFFVIARVFFWHKDRKFTDIIFGNSDRPRAHHVEEA
ncbi:MAG: sodium/glutamate symporter [Eubacteriales bacterium]|nr:sodium/glutamate symporter [Eubacteriales bacterium]